MSAIIQHYQTTESCQTDQTDSKSPDTHLTDALWARISDSLNRAGIRGDKLTTDLLAPIDQLHIGGRQATRKLLSLTPLLPGSQVLEIGSGLGGTARLLADQLECRITAVDITPDFTHAHQQLNQQLGYTGISAICADACTPQVPENSQDLIISQHTLMNIPDKQRLIHTLSKSLKEGGVFLIHEVIAGTNPDPIALPVPWASDPDHSHLPDLAELKRWMSEHGLHCRSVTDVSDNALAWRKKHSQRESGQTQHGQTQQASPLNPKLIFGDGFVKMGKNVMANLAADKIRVIEAVFEKSP